MVKVHWLSRHDLSSAQVQAIEDLHGEDVVVEKNTVVFENDGGLADYIREHDDTFVYAVAGGVHYVMAALEGCTFGMMTNHPGKRQDGQFGLAAIHHVVDGKIERVWVNPDPENDTGEALVPVTR